MKSVVFSTGKAVRNIVAFALVLALVLGLCPSMFTEKAQAAGKSVTVSSVKELKSAVADKKVTSITLKTDAAKNITIPQIEGSEKKALVIDAPNANVSVKSVFSKITLKNVVKLTEKSKGNSYSVSKKAKVGSLVCNKKNANVKIESKKSIKVEVAKKTNLELEGSKKITVDVKKAAKNSKIDANVAVDLKAAANIDLKLGKDAGKSKVDVADKKVKVDIKNESGKKVDERVDGKKVKEEPITTPVVTTTPEVTTTPVVTAAPIVTTAPVITTAPVVTTTPVVTTAPVVTTTPVVTTSPIVTTTPVVTVAPTAEPTVAPTAEPTVAPTAEPTVAPTAEPTVVPTAVPTAVPDPEYYKEIQKIIENEIRFSKNDNSGDKVRKVNDWFSASIRLDGENADSENKDAAALSQELLTSKAGDCRSVAALFNDFMNVLEIPCKTVTSTNMIHNYEGKKSYGHTWNLVCMDDGEWYHTDISQGIGWVEITEDNEWSDYIDDDVYQVFYYANLLMTDEEMTDCDYEWDKEEYPEAKGTEYKGYFDKNFFEIASSLCNIELVYDEDNTITEIIATTTDELNSFECISYYEANGRYIKGKGTLPEGLTFEEIPVLNEDGSLAHTTNTYSDGTVYEDDYDERGHVVRSLCYENGKLVSTRTLTYYENGFAATEKLVYEEDPTHPEYREFDNVTGLCILNEVYELETGDLIREEFSGDDLKLTRYRKDGGTFMSLSHESNVYYNEERDAEGNFVSKTEFEDNSSKETLYEDGEITEIVLRYFRDDCIEEYHYEADGKTLISYWKTSSDEERLILSEIYLEEYVTSSEYDENGKLIKRINTLPDGRKEVYLFDEDGQEYCFEKSDSEGEIFIVGEYLDGGLKETYYSEGEIDYIVYTYFYDDYYDIYSYEADGETLIEHFQTWIESSNLKMEELYEFGDFVTWEYDVNGIITKVTRVYPDETVYVGLFDENEEVYYAEHTDSEGNLLSRYEFEDNVQTETRYTDGEISEVILRYFYDDYSEEYWYEADGETLKFYYMINQDNGNFILSESYCAGNVCTSEYNDDGQCIKTTYTYSDGTKEVEYYDENGYKHSLIYADDETCYSVYDSELENSCIFEDCIMPGTEVESVNVEKNEHSVVVTVLYSDGVTVTDENSDDGTRVKTKTDSYGYQKECYDLSNGLLYMEEAYCDGRMTLRLNNADGSGKVYVYEDFEDISNYQSGRLVEMTEITADGIEISVFIYEDDIRDLLIYDSEKTCLLSARIPEYEDVDSYSIDYKEDSVCTTVIFTDGSVVTDETFNDGKRIATSCVDGTKNVNYFDGDFYYKNEVYFENTLFVTYYDEDGNEIASEYYIDGELVENEEIEEPIEEIEEPVEEIEEHVEEIEEPVEEIEEPVEEVIVA